MKISISLSVTARAIGVKRWSLRRWVDDQVLPIERDPKGHLLIDGGDVLALVWCAEFAKFGMSDEGLSEAWSAVQKGLQVAESAKMHAIARWDEISQTLQIAPMNAAGLAEVETPSGVTLIDLTQCKKAIEEAIFEQARLKVCSHGANLELPQLFLD